jgi:hypothetical protein
MPVPPDQLDALYELMAPMDESHPRFLGCFYGELGTGKTVLAAMAANALGGKWLYIDTAEEFTTLAVNEQWRPLIKNMTRMRYAGLSQFDALCTAIKEGTPGFQYDGIIIDKSSQIAERDLITVTRTKKGIGTINDPDLPEWPHRNVAAYRFRDALNKIISTRCHIIHVAGVRYDKNKMNIEMTGPGFSRSIYNAIADPMQIVGLVTADVVPNKGQEDYIRRVQVQPTATVVAKSRINGLGLSLTFEQLIEGISAFARGERSLVDASLAAIEVSTSYNSDHIEVI